MDSLNVLVYSPLLEDDTSVEGWSKETITYLIENKPKVISFIRKETRKYAPYSFKNADVEDIYSEVLLYFYNADDYNLNKAIENSGSGAILTLENYIYKCTEYCIKRNLTERLKHDKHIVDNGICRDEDGEFSYLLELILDEKSQEYFDETIMDLNRQCEMCEHLRYEYGPDIYQMWYIRLLTLSEGVEEDSYKLILKILGITKSDIAAMKEKSFKDGVMTEFAATIARTGIDESINILEKYVYSAHQIKKTIKELKLAS